MKKYIGTYEFGFNNVDVYVTSHRAGFFQVLPKKRGNDFIEIGLDYKRWFKCLDVILHETFEYCACVLGHRYDRTCRIQGGADRFVFMFDHNEMAEICAWQSDGLSLLYPRIKAEWKRHKKPKKVKRIRGKVEDDG